MRRPAYLFYALALAILGSSLLMPRVLTAADAQPNRIRIEYVVPKSPEHQSIYELIKQRRTLEKLQEIYGAFQLRRDFNLTPCSRSNPATLLCLRSTVAELNRRRSAASCVRHSDVWDLLSVA